MSAPPRRLNAGIGDLAAGRVACPFCGTPVGQGDVTREHADVPPDPPYAASVLCPKDGRTFEVIFRPAS